MKVFGYCLNIFLYFILSVAVIGLSVASSYVVEDDGLGNGAVVVACVNLTAGTLNRTLSVAAYTENGTARGKKILYACFSLSTLEYPEGYDYNADLRVDDEKIKFLFFPPGDPHAGGKRDISAVNGDHCFSIYITADDIKEGNETFVIRLYTKEKHGVLLSPAQVEIVIIDNDGLLCLLLFLM